MDINEINKVVEERANAIVQKQENPLKCETPKFDFKTSPNKDFSEQAKDYVGILATQKAVEDEKLVTDITEKKKEELKHNADAHLKSEQAESKHADIKLQEANYGVYEGVANYAGIKKPLPNKFQKIIFVVLLCIQLPFLAIFGGLTSVLTISMDCADAIMKKMSNIAKSARVLVLSLLGAGAVALVIFITFSPFSL